jgi:hypothetical protein
MAAARSLGEFLAQFADKNVNDLELGFMHPAAVEMVEKHLLRDGCTLAQAQQLQDTALHASKAHRQVIDLEAV